MDDIKRLQRRNLTRRYLSAYEVADVLAEVPRQKIYVGLTSWLSSELRRACALADVAPRILTVMPERRWVYPGSIVSAWLANGGRKALWERVTAHEAKRERPKLRVA